MKFKSLFKTIISLWFLITMNFFLIRLLPGTPLDRAESLNPAVDKKWITELNLNESYIAQYFYYLKRLSQWDFGPSISFPGSSVGQVIQDHLTVTAGLNILALFLTLLITTFFIWVFLNNSSEITKKFWYLVVLSINSMPAILMAPLAILIFSVKLKWVPAAFLSSPIHYILPAFILALRPASYLFRSLSGIMSEEMKKDYVRTAKAKGLSSRAIIFKHVLKNAAVSVVNLLGPLFVSLLSGSAFIEILFAIPGTGTLFISALNERDYFLASALVLMFGGLLIVSSAFFDWV